MVPKELKEEEGCALGPIIVPYMFAGGREPRRVRDLRPYPNDGKHIAALTATELEDMKLPQWAGALFYGDFAKGPVYSEGAEDIIEVVNEFQTISVALFPSRPCRFTSRHHPLPKQGPRLPDNVRSRGHGRLGARLDTTTLGRRAPRVPAWTRSRRGNVYDHPSI